MLRQPIRSLHLSEPRNPSSVEGTADAARGVPALSLVPSVMSTFTVDTPDEQPPTSSRDLRVCSGTADIPAFSELAFIGDGDVTPRPRPSCHERICSIRWDRLFCGPGPGVRDGEGPCHLRIRTPAAPLSADAQQGRAVPTCGPRSPSFPLGILLRNFLLRGTAD